MHRHSLKALPDGRLPDVAQRVIRNGLVDPTARNTIQDVLWAAQSTPEISKKTRREIARALDLADFAHHPDRFMALLDGLWVLDDDPLLGLLTGTPTGLRARIDRHVLRNPGDWSTEELLEQLGAFDVGDARFARFLEGLVSAYTIPDEPAQRRLAATINPHLHTVAAELREVGTDGGYPVFDLVSTRSARTRRPKNLVFATLTKPDIRFRDAVDNDIEVLGNADDVLVYDRPIGADGLRWRDLQTWWKDQHNLPGDTEAKRSLYARLTRCLPDTSPPQRTLFDLYHEIHDPAVYGLPAPLPEVWLHWGPKTARARGAQALLNFRMDFLLLLPHGHRIVLEVDGMHYYTTQGRPDSAKYAANMRGDRDLKLAGYEVFRFGTHDLRDRARTLLQQFDVTPAPTEPAPRHDTPGTRLPPERVIAPHRPAVGRYRGPGDDVPGRPPRPARRTGGAALLPLEQDLNPPTPFRPDGSPGPDHQPAPARTPPVPETCRPVRWARMGVVDTERCSPAEDLLYWRGDLPELLRAARHHRTSTPATFTRGHAAALEKTLAGLAGPDQLTAWAQAVHFQEEVDIDEEHQDLLTQFLVEISTPELFEPVTAETCRRWLHRIRTPSRSAADR